MARNQEGDRVRRERTAHGPPGYLVGYRLLNAVDMRGFNLVTAWTLLAAGIKLAYDGLAG